MRSLDFQHTCGTIDRVIAEVREAVSQAIDLAICDTVPSMPQETVDKLVDKYMADNYNFIEGQIEDLRALNADMRCAADVQIDNLADEVSTVESELSDAADHVAELVATVEELTDQLSTLHEEIRDNRLTMVYPAT